MIGDHFLDCHSFDTKFVRMFEKYLTETQTQDVLFCVQYTATFIGQQVI